LLSRNEEIHKQNSAGINHQVIFAVNGRNRALQVSKNGHEFNSYHIALIYSDSISSLVAVNDKVTHVPKPTGVIFALHSRNISPKYRFKSESFLMENLKIICICGIIIKKKGLCLSIIL